MFFPGARARVLQNCLAGWLAAGWQSSGRRSRWQLASRRVILVSRLHSRVRVRAIECAPPGTAGEVVYSDGFAGVYAPGVVLLLGLCALLRLGMLRYYARIVCEVRVF